MINDPVLWLGSVLLVGAIMALSARSAGAPAASGAMVGGAALLWAIRASSVAALPGEAGADDGVTLVRNLLLAILCLKVGSGIEVNRVRRIIGSLALTALAQSAAVFGAVCLASFTAGLDRFHSLVLAAAAIAASPAAIEAAASEARARGDMTLRLRSLSGASVVLALVALPIVSASRHGATFLAMLPGLAAGLIVGAGCGIAILLPLSRMATRGAILSCFALGCVLLTLLASGATGPFLIPMAIVAGFFCGNFPTNREIVRESLDDMALPCAIAYFALTGAAWFEVPSAPLLLAAALVIAARGMALMISTIVVRGTSAGFGEAAGLIPMGGFITASVFLPGGPAPAGGSSDDLISILILAGLVSEAAGMAAVRWSVIRSGEAAAGAERADAWRESMR